MSVVITAANTHDMKAAVQTMDSTIINRPLPKKFRRQQLCLDKAYDFEAVQEQAIKRNYVLDIRHRGEKKPRKKRYKRSRRVEKRTNSFLAQQVSEIANQVREEIRELSGTGAAGILLHCVQELILG